MPDERWEVVVMRRQAAGGGVLLTLNALKVGDVGDLGEGWADVEANAGIGAEVARARKDTISLLLASSDLALARRLSKRVPSSSPASSSPHSTRLS